MKLSLRSKHKKHLIEQMKQPLKTPLVLKKHWSIDFMNDALTAGRKLLYLKLYTL